MFVRASAISIRDKHMVYFVFRDRSLQIKKASSDSVINLPFDESVESELKEFDK